MINKKLVPPDGGYGWVIVGACGLYYFVTLPIEKGFGLVFNETFRDLGFSAAKTSIIMNTNSAFSMFIGIIVAPLLKHIDYRKVSLIAGGLIAIGVLLTAFARSFTEYIITYGIITSLGYGMGVQAYKLVQNVYFVKRRTKAVGYILTICGFGPVIMPQIFSALMDSYGVTGAVTIIASISTHTLISGLLLQPVEWHIKEEIVEEVRDIEKNKLLEKEAPCSEAAYNGISAMLTLEEAIQVEATYNMDADLSGSALSLHHEIQENSTLVSSRHKNTAPSMKYQTDMEMNDFQPMLQKNKNRYMENTNIYVINKQNDTILDLVLPKNLLQDENKTNDRSLVKRIGKNIVNTWDLTLLKDLTYVNIMIGLSFAVFSELSFSLLTPFIMRDFGLTMQQIATFMSLVSVMEICFRFITPYIGDYLSKSVRVMFVWSLILLIFSRFSLLLASDYSGLLFCAIFLGICKGFRTVYWTLVIPNSVPIERLAAASGLQSTFNSFLIWTGGPFLGFVKDMTGSYKNCIFVINFLTFLTIVLWSTEFVYKLHQSRRKLVQK